MDLKSFYPLCKKPRRSNRLIAREVEEKKVQAIATKPLGYIDMLPLEVKFKILGHLSVEDLSLLTITSKAMRNLVECYCVTMFSTRGIAVHSQTHSIMDMEQQAEWLTQYTKLGLLVKRSTCLYATKERLKIVNDFLTRMMCRNTESCKNRRVCIGELCFGKFLHTLIAGWDDSECQRTFDSLCQHTSVLKHIKIVVSSRPGAHADIEYDVRCFLRRVFLDSSNSVADKAFWLTRILKPWPLVQQARLLYLLYGVVQGGVVAWYQMCESAVNTSLTVQYFGSIACALNTLHRQSKEWTEDELISILDEMTSCPEEWVGENKASMLASCGDYLTSKMLISKAINGRVAELNSIITAFCVMSIKQSCDLKFVMKHVRTVLQTMENSRDRVFFVNGLINRFNELVFHLHVDNETDDADDTDFFVMLTAFTQFSLRLIHLAYKELL